MNAPPSQEPRWYHIVGIGIAFVAALLLWGFGFDLAAKAMHSGLVDKVLNAVTNPWIWCGLIVASIAVSLLNARR